jgi:peptidoglycan glycosyltransferase
MMGGSRHTGSSVPRSSSGVRPLLFFLNLVVFPGLLVCGAAVAAPYDGIDLPIEAEGRAFGAEGRAIGAEGRGALALDREAKDSAVVPTGTVQLGGEAVEQRRVVPGRVERGPELAALPRRANQEIARTPVLPRLSKLPTADKLRNGRFVSTLRNGEVAVLSLDVELQRYVTDLVRRAQAPHVAVVAMNPTNGRILAYASKSKTISDLVTHAGFPAASLFKVVTSAAALERTKLEPDSLIPFRGGTYELERWNFSPDPRRDRRMMSLTEALGRSCNPVFGRVALNYLSAPILQFYANAFGFNQSIGFDAPLELSEAEVPADSFLRSRTGAGFGDVYISPVHAAALMAGLANRGVMPRPSLIEGVYPVGSAKLIPIGAQMQKKMVNPATARRLMTMMVASTTTGTSRRDFMLKKKPILGNVLVAAKTGTLTGKNPAGLNQWFIAAAPINSPRIAIAIISVDPRNASARPARMARQIFQNYL